MNHSDDPGPPMYTKQAPAVEIRDRGLWRIRLITATSFMASSLIVVSLAGYFNRQYSHPAATHVVVVPTTSPPAIRPTGTTPAPTTATTVPPNANATVPTVAPSGPTAQASPPSSAAYSATPVPMPAPAPTPVTSPPVTAPPVTAPPVTAPPTTTVTTGASGAG